MNGGRKTRGRRPPSHRGCDCPLSQKSHHTRIFPRSARRASENFSIARIPRSASLRPHCTRHMACMMNAAGLRPAKLTLGGASPANRDSRADLAGGEPPTRPVARPRVAVSHRVSRAAQRVRFREIFVSFDARPPPRGASSPRLYVVRRIRKIPPFVAKQKVFGIPIANMTTDIRRKAKAINFGIIYGISSLAIVSYYEEVSNTQKIVYFRIE